MHLAFTIVCGVCNINKICQCTVHSLFLLKSFVALHEGVLSFVLFQVIFFFISNFFFKFKFFFQICQMLSRSIFFIFPFPKVFSIFLNASPITFFQKSYFFFKDANIIQIYVFFKFKMKVQWGWGFNLLNGFLLLFSLILWETL